MPRKNSKKNPRKKRITSPENKDPEKVPVDELKKKLRQKLMESRLARTSRVVRDKEMDDIEDKLESRKLPAKTKKKLKERLKLLEDIEEKEINSVNTDYPEYPDTGGYGGAMVRDD